MQRDAKRSTFGILGGIGLGAAFMYLLDPARGTRRRHLVRDQLAHAGRVAGDAMDTTARDLRNRAQGTVAAARARMKGDDADDTVVAERVRSALGRAVSHPSAITVAAEQGRVALGGPVLEREVERLLAAVRGVRGVREVENRLEVHASAENVPGLQGGVGRTGELPELAQEHWAPATRLLTGAAGGALALYAARRRNTVGALLGVGGLALAARGATNLNARRLAGARAGRRAVDVQKTITVNAPVERVFAYFSAWENWPAWMSHVREVQRTGAVAGNDRTHWVVDGPAGVPVAWDAITTKLVPNEAIGWKSVEGAAVGHEGLVRFRPTADGATTIDVRMSYNPPAGAIEHAVAAFFGRDPKQQMDDDLARLRTTIETGNPPSDAARSEVARSAGTTSATLREPPAAQPPSA